MLQTDFPILLREHQNMVFSIALRIAGDPGTAEEIAQDVFMELHSKLGDLSSPDHVLYWLRRVASHRSIDRIRRASTKPEIGMDEAALEGIADLAARREPSDPLLSRNLQQLVASLPPLQRSVLTLRYQEDLSPDEIASTLEMPVATVKSHLQRTLKLLRTKAERMLR